MTTIRSDVLVLGSTLGGWIAANYLARAGLRVVLLEEEAHAKRPALLREPFLLSSLESGGRIMRVLRELALPLIEQREIQREPVALQVILPKARIDLVRGRDALTRELAAHGLGDAKAIRSWLDAVDTRGAQTQAELWEKSGRGRAPARLVQRRSAAAASEAGLPPAPEGLDSFVRAQLSALCALETPAQAPAPALLLRMTREGGFRMPHSEIPFLGLFRRRLETLYGEIHQAGRFHLISDRTEVAVELPRDQIFGRALVIAAPREPLRRFLAQAGSSPDWLKPSAPPLQTPTRIFRADRDYLPQGMASRVIRAEDDSAGALHWLARSPDPKDSRFDWLVAYGPGACKLPAENPLGSLAPFAGPGILPVGPGATPRWDLDAGNLRFREAGIPVSLKHRPPVVCVGPELAPGLGFEGEVLCARRVALRLAEWLGRRRRVV